MHHTDKYSQHSSIIWPVWWNGWVFVCELSGCGLESCYCHYGRIAVYLKATLKSLSAQSNAYKFQNNS